MAAFAAVPMGAQAGWRRARVEAVRPGAGANGAELRTFREGWLFFPPAVETMEYDLDGNLISDARWTYGWDGESSRGAKARWTADFGGCPAGVRARVERPNQNRLIWMEEKVIPGNGIRPARQRLEFGYDGQSRRVVQRVLQKVAETSSWSLRQERRFLYDGWYMIAESSRGTEARWTDGTAGCPGGVRARAERPNQLDVPSNGQARLHRSYAWGLDASGTLTGAGGVGGLLLTSHHTPQADGGTQVTTLAPLYDFNGNVLAYADVATSIITHRMEYDPFGQELSLDTLLPGEGAAEAPRFRFSTKYTDGETGLVYYGYRSYSLELGRWVNRDPIEERGGINLYGMVGNDAVNRSDILGLNDNGTVPYSKGVPMGIAGIEMTCLQWALGLVVKPPGAEDHYDEIAARGCSTASCYSNCRSGFYKIELFEDGNNPLNWHLYRWYADDTNCTCKYGALDVYHKIEGPMEDYRSVYNPTGEVNRVCYCCPNG